MPASFFADEQSYILREKFFNSGRIDCINYYPAEAKLFGGDVYKRQAYTGREVQDIPGVLAVFAERRKDSFGPYVRLMSVTLN